METAAVSKSAESELIEKARGRDLQAFSELVRLYQEKILRVSYALVGNREDARDLAQEAFVKAWDSLSGFKGGSLFSTWIHRILVNACKDFLRKKSVRRSLSVFIRPNDEDENPERAEEKIVSREPDALENLEHQELGEAIREAMKELPVQQQIAFGLRYLDGMSLEQIATAMKISEGAVKAHLWHAAQKMQQKLTAFVPERR